MQTRLQQRLRESKWEAKMGGTDPPEWGPPREAHLGLLPKGLSSGNLGQLRGPKNIVCVCVCVRILLFFWERGSTMSPIGFLECFVNLQENLKGGLYPTRPSSQSPSKPSQGSMT